MINIEKKFPKGNLHFHAVPMGTDWCISVFGGDKPLIGAVSMGIHIDHATLAEIQEIEVLIMAMGAEMSQRACESARLFGS